MTPNVEVRKGFLNTGFIHLRLGCNSTDRGFCNEENIDRQDIW